MAGGPLRYYVMTRTKRLRDFFIGNSEVCIDRCEQSSGLPRGNMSEGDNVFKSVQPAIPLPSERHQSTPLHDPVQGLLQAGTRYSLVRNDAFHAAT
ncbi:hypothetical protein KQX54_004507 [Cotesia glomerata]|uniref:Uncharacterized protein n=1 Tax=Cotesia glomerata TaxID=32391 RepID=A0AAV7IIZ7_COTGL|nr:hypothetical protein KQX54_004507 [Cotesia glomerata]